MSEKAHKLTHGGRRQATIKYNGKKFVGKNVEVPNWLACYSSFEKVSHSNSESDASFDLTTFETVDEFIEVLENVDLDWYWDYYRINMPVDNDDYFYYVWGNVHGMLVLGNNPITGEWHNGEYKQEAYCSYIGVSGRDYFVENAVSSIHDYGHFVDWDSENRSFI